jgi:hypothetical protein
MARQMDGLVGQPRRFASVPVVARLLGRMALYVFACVPVRANVRACVCMCIHRSIYTLRRAWLAVQNGIRVSLFPVFAHNHNQHHIVNGTAARELVHALSGVDVAHSTFGGGPIDQILLAAQVGR